MESQNSTKCATNGATAASSYVDRDKLALDHVPLVKHIVGRLSFDLPPSFDRDDMYGFGMLGLLAAADSWDASRGLQFSTYAYSRIRGAILDELRRQDFLPRGRRERVRALDEVMQRYQKERGARPSPEELALELSITVEEVDEILLSSMSAAQVSLDDGPTEGLVAMLSDPRCEGPDGSAEFAEMKELLVETITKLPEQEKTVITLYYGDDLLLKEISTVLGVTESRVSQIHSRALYRLNKTLGALTGEPQRED
ncbi:MAG: RNA polymerase sigma factor for flagellar operon FliA [Chlamydiales bacterium]|jgi:RNA polymerase sigma factor for flagellar operon FliA